MLILGLFFENGTKLEQVTRLFSIIGLSIAALQCLTANGRQARERLAKQDARARTRSSSGAFARECAEQLIESRKLSTAARRCGCRAGTARLLFFCRRFLFQIKRKCRNAGSIYHLIIVHSEGKKRFLRGFRAAVAAAVRRGRRTLQVAPNRLQISIHQPVLSYYAALYMQKSRQTLLSGLFAVL